MKKELAQLYKSVEKLERHLIKSTDERKELIEAVSDVHQQSAKNLVEYTALRATDFNDLQEKLHDWGLSSLSSSESHIMQQLQAVLQRLGKTYTKKELSILNNETAANILKQKSEKLFGAKTDDLPHIMVTFDHKIGSDAKFIAQLLKKGMNIARINCARDNEVAWSEIIKNIKTASAHTGIGCKIYMDLPGPKIRTVILGRGNKKDKVKIEEGSIFYLVEDETKFNKKDIVIGCTRKGIIQNLKSGQRVMFDDGEIEAVVKSIKNRTATLELVRNSKDNLKLRADRGINFPDTELDLEILSDFDKKCISFICQHAHLIGFSYVRNPSDLTMLQSLIAEEEKQAAIIIKIENTEAINNMPALILQGMQREHFGILVARGDLAVEVGFERLSEIQDEILWFAEAAHIPAIWATEVLDTLHKTGVATRAEMTDAAHASMAECVMLNKGDYTLEAIKTLKDVLSRNLRHRNKKRFNMPVLKIAERIMEKKDWGIDQSASE